MKVVFDFDGTLVDSMPLLRKVATQIIVERYDETPAEADRKYMATVGRSFLNQLDTLYPNDPRNLTSWDDFALELGDVYDKVQVHDGVAVSIDALNERGIEYAAVSSTDSFYVSTYLHEHLPEFRGKILGFDFGSKLSQLSTAFGGVEQRWFIGDSPWDGVCAKYVNSRFIAVTHTFRSHIFFEGGYMNVVQSIPLAVDEVLQALETSSIGQTGTDG